MINYEEMLFNIFITTKSEQEKYAKILKLIKEVERISEKTTDIFHYNQYVELSNSINNAGHEERRSDDISKLFKFRVDIGNKYPEDNY